MWFLKTEKYFIVGKCVQIAKFQGQGTPKELSYCRVKYKNYS